MKNLLSLVLFILSFEALAEGRLDLSYGYFSITSKAADKTTSISNAGATNLAYLIPFSEKLQAVLGYSVLLSDMSGTDKGYGINLGVNYFPLSSSKNELFKDDVFQVERYEMWKPFVGLGFYQRDFQSIKNSYAGFGVSGGIERYFNKAMSFKAEIRYITLTGTNSTTAKEVNALLGVIFRI